MADIAVDDVTFSDNLTCASDGGNTDLRVLQGNHICGSQT